MNKEEGAAPAVSGECVMQGGIWMDVSKYQEHSGSDKGRHVWEELAQLSGRQSWSIPGVKPCSVCLCTLLTY